MKQRKVYLDALRIIACFLVIVNHTNSQIFLSLTPGVTWLTSLSYFLICRTAVPLFLMISGTTLLCKEDSYSKSFFRILRIIIVIAVFSLIYYVMNCEQNRTPFNPIQYFKSIYNSNITNSYWYLYLYLGVLFMIPILQKLIKHLSNKDFKYFFALSFAFLGGMPILIHFIPKLQYSSLISFPIFGTTIGLILAGYFLEYNFICTKNIFIASIVVFIISIFVTALLTYREYIKDSKNYLFFSDTSLITILCPSICLFVIIKYIFDHIQFKELSKKVICTVGRCTFGIYLLSDFFIIKYSPIYGAMVTRIHPLFAVILYEFIIFLSGLIITYILIKLPLVKKIL